ncbi:hypothetical protein AaE_009462 [Aphanomyces astaci]|uniref:PH domain-containing protein n=1 Tax=Aphanomyces astaci TaxID=112090 RepID=A0A6A5A891_APHAT|nr:hypothetical protein AaE_009462 [Aphanomyces astaci]
MVLKSGKLEKHSQTIFGSKWKVKWVHLDEATLKCYPMASLSWPSHVFQGAKSKLIQLDEYTVSMLDESKFHRKHCFQLTGKQKQKTKIFACSSDRECLEWVGAILNPHVAKKSNQADDDDDDDGSEYIIPCVATV